MSPLESYCAQCHEEFISPTTVGLQEVEKKHHDESTDPVSHPHIFGIFSVFERDDFGKHEIGHDVFLGGRLINSYRFRKTISVSQNVDTELVEV